MYLIPHSYSYSQAFGPKDDIKLFKLPDILHSDKVGKHLQDNYEVAIQARASANHRSISENCTFLAPNDPCLDAWRDHGTGPYGLVANPAAFIYRSSQAQTADADLFLSGTVGPGLRGFWPGYSQAGVPPNSSAAIVIRMRSSNKKGYVRLHSSKLQVPPEINFNYFPNLSTSLNANFHLQAMAEGMQHLLRVFKALPPPHGPYTIHSPKPNVELKQAVADEAFSHHASSTCSMGKNIHDSVVDSEFRVHGARKLRVVDASVLPNPIGAFPILILGVTILTVMRLKSSGRVS